MRLEQDYLNGVDVKEGEIVVLENVRVSKGEKKNDPELGKKYAALCDVFVMDAFNFSSPCSSINLQRSRVCTGCLCRSITLRRN